MKVRSIITAVGVAVSLMLSLSLPEAFPAEVRRELERAFFPRSGNVVVPKPPARESPVSQERSHSTPDQAGPVSDRSWRIYRNDKLSYRVELPSDAMLDESRPEAIRLLFREDFWSGTNTVSDLFSFEIDTEDNPMHLTAEQWARRVLAGGDPDAILNETSIGIGGLEAYRVTVFALDETTVHVYISTDARLYVMTFSDPDSIGELPGDLQAALKQKMERILTSFRSGS
jgi:hypothetical protein